MSVAKEVAQETPQAENKEERPTSFCQWKNELGNYYIPYPKINFVKAVPAGFYKIEWNSKEQLYMLVERTVYNDELLKLPYPNFDSIINDIEYFWNSEQKFKNYKYTYKRGILLHGSPGNGKTCLTMLLSQNVIKRGGIVLSINDANSLESYSLLVPIFRCIQKNTPILILFEDLDSLLIREEVETLLLNILDGMNQTHNVVYIGCTNYPEKLKERILNRPSRFDRRYQIDSPNEDIRKYYFVNKIKSNDLEKIDLNEWVKKSEGLSIAHLGEIIKSVFIFNKNLDDIIMELRGMKEYISSTKYKGTGQVGIGFKEKSL